MGVNMIIKWLKIFSLFIMIGFIGWFTISYVDVVIHNLTIGYKYPSWNLLALLMQ